MTSTPIVCTLERDAAQRRAALIRDLCDRLLVARRQVAGGLLLSFRDEPGAERELRDLAAAEARCCPFLTLDVRRAGGSLSLAVTGPADALPAIEALVGPD